MKSNVDQAEEFTVKSGEKKTNKGRAKKDKGEWRSVSG